jgi:hypothetical protein
MRTISGYTEKHHVIPKCFGGNEGNNLVQLTAREHFICHLLLVKMTSGLARSKMSYALLMFTRKNSNLQRIIPNSHQYQQIRKYISAAASSFHKGKIVSQASKDKRKETLRLTPLHRTDAMKQRQSVISKAFWVTNRDKMIDALNSPTTKTKQSASAKLRITSLETRQKHSEVHRGSGNGNAKLIQATSPNGTTYKCNGSFQSFCMEHELPFSTMCHILHKSRSFNKGRTVGWDARFVTE